jgi:hypothetical protein
MMLPFIAVAQQRHELQWKQFDTLAFDARLEDYSTESIFFYHAFVKNGVKENSHSGDFSFAAHAKPLDLFGYWDKKGDEHYHILLTKVGYVLDKPVDFFTKERLSDPGYISRTIPEASIQKTDSAFHISTGFGAPDIDYTLDFYSPQEFDHQYPALKDYFTKYDGPGFSPEFVVVQHNYHYGKVLFQKTSKMSVSISRYFELNKQQTLVVNYTLNYILNFPPEIVGGDDYLIRKIKEGIKALIDETQVVCRMTVMAE